MKNWSGQWSIMGWRIGSSNVFAEAKSGRALIELAAELAGEVVAVFKAAAESHRGNGQIRNRKHGRRLMETQFQQISDWRHAGQVPELTAEITVDIRAKIHLSRTSANLLELSTFKAFPGQSQALFLFLIE